MNPDLELISKLQAENAKLLLQNEAMRRSLTDVMQFSSDGRSQVVAKGTLDAHGGPDQDCMVKQKCGFCRGAGYIETVVTGDRNTCAICHGSGLLEKLKDETPSPAGEEWPPKSCNRHQNCEKAAAKFLAENGREPGVNFHCWSEDCEDCFGK